MRQRVETSASPVAIEFRRVSKRYRLYQSDKMRFLSVFSRKVPHKVVYANKNLSFSIAPGEAVAILGKNGAGKSTALKMITGVVFPTTGKVIVNGRVSALLELTAGFDKELTGRENIHLRGEIWGLTPREIRRLVRQAVSFANIGDYIDQPVRTYSSGMKARLGFAISANIRPDILIIDEALSVGDSTFRRKCKALIDEIVEQEHVTVLLVTHSARAAASLCTRGLVLRNGELAFDGPIEAAIEFYEGKPLEADDLDDDFSDI